MSIENSPKSSAPPSAAADGRPIDFESTATEAESAPIRQLEVESTHAPVPRQRGAPAQGDS